MKLTRNKVLELTDNGRMLFEAYLPDLSIVGDRGESNITSPFTNTPNSFSVFSWKKWLFKDYSRGGDYGDIFFFVALLYKLDLKADFVKILAIIEVKMKEMGSLSDSRNESTYINKENGEKLVLADAEFSKPHIKKLFQMFHPLMDEKSRFTIRLVKHFVKHEGKKTINRNFHWSKPKETFLLLLLRMAVITFFITLQQGKHTSGALSRKTM